jgi:hypothetical protein
MWIRFNLFLTLETGLVALLFVKDTGALTRLAVATVEAIISFIWFFIGLQDRCLVLVYREHIRQAASSLADLHITSSGYPTQVKSTTPGRNLWAGQSDHAYMNESGTNCGRSRRQLLSIGCVHEGGVPALEHAG